MRFASVRDYSLTDFKEFAFFANTCFERTGEKQREVPNVSVNKSARTGCCTRRGRGNITES
jgi:hypothetical protein